MSAIPQGPFSSHVPEALLGPLNQVERRNAPKELFVAGHVELLKNTWRVSVVGSRRASVEGVKRARRLARALVERKVVVVSGLAEGVDTAAHRTAIESGGRTIAVLGTPLNKVFPAKNRDLQTLIMQEHLGISQFPVGHPVLRRTFPMRNRTMALISHASVIVEAGDSSGALSQGWEALRLGRPLFIMKSVAERVDLRWPSDMQRYGAQVLGKPEQLFDFLPVDSGGPLAEVAL